MLSLVGGATPEFWSVEEGTVKAAVVNLNNRRDELNDLVTQWDTLPPYVRDDVVDRLVQAGRRLAEALFGEQCKAFLQTLLDYKIDWLSLVFSCDFPPFPWDLLVFPDEHKWLGELLMLGPTFPVKSPGDRLVRNYVENQPLLAGYADDNRLGGGTVEFDAVQAVASGPVAVLAKLPAGYVTSVGIQEIERWLSRPRRLFHFKCHSQQSPVGQNHYADVGLRTNAMANGEKFQSQGQNLRNSAVFLNMCGSATSRYSDRKALTRVFLEQKAKAVCGTTGAVCNNFANHFAQAFYENVRQHHKTFFDALRATRNEVVAQTRHPMALFYVFSGQPDFALRP
jgi:hypothetical protein